MPEVWNGCGTHALKSPVFRSPQNSGDLFSRHPSRKTQMQLFGRALFYSIVLGLLLNLVIVMAQGDIYYDPDAIMDVVPEECQNNCTPLSDTFEACIDTDCLCTVQNNQILLRCVDCLYHVEQGPQTYEAAQLTLRDFSIVCIDYDIPALTVATSSSATASSTSRSPAPTSSNTQSSQPTSEAPPTSSNTSLTTGSPATASLAPSSQSSKPSGTLSATSPAITTGLTPVPQQCHLALRSKQRILVRRKSYR